jgi:iron complex outermembrane receptor protein
MKYFLIGAPWVRRAFVLGACIGAPVGLLAQTKAIGQFPDAVISASRIPQDPILMPQGVWVITAEEIRSSGVATANEAIRWLGGISGRIDSSGGRDQTLDIRGFGESSASNIVVLVDGVRQNEGDMSGASLSWIPVESIEKIEIVKGSGSVMHGEGATAGVINIITNKGLSEPGATVGVSLGSLATREIKASIGTRTQSWRFLVSGSNYQTDNHRVNFFNRQSNGLLRATWSEGADLLSFQLGGESGKGGLPGGITVQDFATYSKKTYKPLDNGNNDSTHTSVNGDFGIGDWRVAFDLGHKNVNIDSNYVADDFYSQNKTRSTRAGFRSWRNFSDEGLTHKFLVGADTERWSQDRNNNYGNTQVDQSSDALFGRYELVSQRRGVSAYAGIRRTQSKRQAQGDFSGQLDVNNQSWDIGFAKSVTDGSEVFARIGTSFRLANADEFSCYTYYCPANTLNLLKPQQSRDHEVGFKQRQDWGQWSARAYRYALTNEIGIGTDQFSNVNYDPTRRQGLEFDAKARINSKMDAVVQYAYREAVFTEGSYAGKQVPLAPQNVLTARLSYMLNDTQNLSLMTQWVSSQKISGDFGNTCQDEIASYGLVNARFSQKINSWTLSASLNNLFDKHYYNLRTRCDPTKKSIYPEVGRTFLVTLQNRF